jgi:hypothetical protein
MAGPRVSTTVLREPHRRGDQLTVAVQLTEREVAEARQHTTALAHYPLAAATPADASLHRPTHAAGRPPATGGGQAADPRAASIAAQLGLDPARLAQGG